ncbi:DUF1992 domain-containing protein [Antribacter gilvus]|uniref:DnaJ family domain-containing protein n=1 Tax=Antribacter gilvus TaxID=2304675 RepID=UPI000F7B2C0C|nr:DUF1992 domain-containing protein [Antribacter gilvus]
MDRRPGTDDDPARRAAQYRVNREAADDRAADGAPAPEEEQAPRPRMDDRARFVDTVIDQAIRRGEFDDLPLHGKPIPSLKSGAHDPDWWLKNLVEREQITGILPTGQLRKDGAELDDTLDHEVTEDRVREIVQEFNARVVDARRQLMGGPPVVTPTRDVEREVVRWRERRAARQAERHGSARVPGGAGVPPVRKVTGPSSGAGAKRPWWKFWG